MVTKEDMTISFLEELIGTRTKLRTFEFLLEHPICEYSIRDICENTWLSIQSVKNALNIFTEYGMLTVTRKEGEDYYQINMESPIVEAFLELHLKLAEVLVERER